MGALVLGLMVLAVAVGAGEGARTLWRRRVRDLLVRDGLGDPSTRGRSLAALTASLDRIARGGRLLGRRTVERELAETRLALALLLLVDDRPEETLDQLMEINPDRIPRHLQAAMALHAAEAHLRLREWDAAERVLEGFPHDTLNANGLALRSNARAQIRLGRGDARSALRTLDEAEPIPVAVRDELAMTRARALALDTGSSTNAEVTRLLSGLQRGLLERLLFLHGGEPAAQAARRILDGLQ